MLQIINTGKSSAQENMDRDVDLLESLDPKGDPILHFYDWAKPAVTFGYFIKPSQFLDLGAVQRLGLDLGRRPTGGGIVFHIWDWAFSFLMPSFHPAYSINTLDNYRFVNRAVLAAVVEILPATTPILVETNFEARSEDCSHFCMARPTQYDVIYEGRKIAGAAQRRRKQGYLHQGTISLASPDVLLLKEILFSKQAVLEAMLAHSFTPNMPLERSRLLLQKSLTEKLQTALSLAAL